MEVLPLGQIAGHRGRGGELTVKVLGGDASLWTELAMLNLAMLYRTQGQYSLHQAVLSRIRIRRGM